MGGYEGGGEGVDGGGGGCVAIFICVIISMEHFFYVSLFRDRAQLIFGSLFLRPAFTKCFVPELRNPLLLNTAISMGRNFDKEPLVPREVGLG